MQRGDAGDPGLRILHTVYPTAYLLRLRGNTLPATRGDLAAAFDSAAAWGLALIVDLSALDFGDEELLGHLINARRTSGITLVGPLSDSFRRRLDTAGVSALFTIQPNVAAALGQ
ncbi:MULTISPECIES: STAS domain-containing protein [Streptomyces]|uniref:STAS domain-containing protein n=1 Tax=Streptomyces TaxID=1883 RepID=UPI0021B49B02|nr:STAS domain-containing protein [Streptomyces sp. CS-7]MCT6781890.1 STAS domain-containing protein [Streptomyces sp. CS-7]